MINRIKVRKGNKIIRASENELAKYLGKGYVIVEEKKADVPQKTVVQKPTEEAVEEPKPKKTTRRKKSTDSK